MVISVIVPFKNEECFIKQCIEALIDQEYDKDKYELIFINDGSMDQSEEIVRQYEEIILLKGKWGNAFLARNEGLKIAKGRIFAFTDADCVVSKDWLNKICQSMQDSSVGIVLGQRLFPSNSSVGLHYFQDYENAKMKYLIQRRLNKYYYGYTNNMAVRTDVFEKIGLFNNLEIEGDTDFIHRSLACDELGNIVYNPDIIVTHLEISRVRHWLKKMETYGQYNARLSKKLDYQSLAYKTKLDIFRVCAQANRYSLKGQMGFLCALALGDIYYKKGELKGLLNYS